MTSQDVILTLEGGVRLIKLNRPNKRNALAIETYQFLANTLIRDAEDDNVVISIITGTGEYFSSGNHISGLNPEQSADIDKFIDFRLDVVKNFIKALINYPKILIAVINGPAIGIGTTLTALCDIVYASSRASFEIPFIRLGLCMEGCSSYLFPAMLGKSKTSEMLFFNHRLTAEEGCKLGFIAKVIPHHELDDFINSLYKYGSLSVESVKQNKKLMTDHKRKILNDCNESELKELKNCFMSEEFTNAMMKFLSKSKL